MAGWDLIDVKPRYAAAYREVARRIAGLVADTVRDDDLIWVHDYQRCCHVWMAPVWQYDFRRCLSFAGSGAVMSPACFCGTK